MYQFYSTKTNNMVLKTNITMCVCVGCIFLYAHSSDDAGTLRDVKTAAEVRGEWRVRDVSVIPED